MGELDVAIIGAGPGGISAASWCADLGLRARIFDASAHSGGQLHNIFGPIRNYPGLSAANGEELAEAFAASLADRPLSYQFKFRLERIEIDGGRVHVSSADASHAAKFAIVATGVRRRRLNVPGEGEFAGRGILYSGSRDRDQVRGRSVAVIGGGDAAFENALILAEYADSVTIIHRRDEFAARQEFVDRVADTPKIRIITGATVSAFEGDERLRRVTIGEGKDPVAVDAAVIRIGVVPNSELLGDLARLDAKGYVVVDASARTSHPRIFAVGDVAHPLSPTIATAVGTAATAVKSIHHDLRACE